MTNFVGESLKTLLVIYLVIIIGKYFLKRTWFGRTIVLLFKITKEITMFGYYTTLKIYKFVDKKVKQQKIKSNPQKKAAPDKKVVNFSSYQFKSHKGN